MKTLNGVFDKIASVENLKASICEAARGKRHKRSVRYALKHQKEVAEMLHEQLVSGTWTPPEVHHAHMIGDGVSSKKREIVCPEFVREQVVHHAILRVIAPFIVRRFDRWSCGSIPGRGQEELAAMLMKRMRKEPRLFKYCTKGDVKKFFKSVSIEQLKKIVRRYIRDRRLLAVLDKIIECNKIKDNNGNVHRAGIPIGFFTSPWFANMVLDFMDKDIRAHHIHVFGRFMDDFIAFGPNKRALRNTLVDAEKGIARFGLRYKHQISVHRFGSDWSDGLRMTSFAICRNRIKLRDRIFLKARRKASRIVRKMRNNERVTAVDAGAIIAYAGKFRAFGAYKAFTTHVLKCGKLKFSAFRRMIANKSRKSKKECK